MALNRNTDSVDVRVRSADDVIATRAEDYALACTVCGKGHAPTVRTVRCAECTGTLTIAGVNGRRARADWVASVELGQGGTPTIELPSVRDALGVASVLAKIEYLAPTGSFKDRGSAVLIAAAAEEGVSEFVEDSSGNAGASMAAYAAAMGIRAHIFAPASASSGKLDQIRVFGAQLHAIDGTRLEVTEAAMEFGRERGIPYLSHALSPWFIEGMRSFAEEVRESEQSPSDVVLPVGNGSLLLALAGVFWDGQSAGNTAPRLHAVQSCAVNPLVRAVWGEEESAGDAQAQRTIASGISVSSPPRLAEMVNAVNASGGTAVTVSDAAMSRWQQRLAESEGIFCEVTSAAALAGLEMLIGDGVIGESASVLVPITGSGLKEPL